MNSRAEIAPTNINFRLNNLAARVDFGLVMALALSLFSLWPLLYRPGLSDGHDTLHHVYRTAEMARLWSDGVWLPRWADTFYYGYGSPVFSYYAPLTYYLTAALTHFAGLDIFNSYRVLIALCSLASGAGMYLFVKLRVSALGGVIAALCYVYSPYLLYTEPYGRGDFPELLSFAIFPWVMWAFEPMQSVGTRLPKAWASAPRIIFAALTIPLLILSHNLMGLALFALLIAWVAWNQVSFSPPYGWGGARGWGLLFLAPLGFGLAAWFWLPVMLEQREVRLANVMEVFQRNQADYFNFYIQPYRLFGLSPRADLTAINGMTLNFCLGVAQWVLTITGIFVGTRLSASAQQRNTMIFFALVAVILIFLMLPLSSFLWQSIPAMAYLLFPWRLLGPAAFCLAVLAGMNALWLERLPAKFAAPLIAIIPIIILALATPAMYATKWLTEPVDASIAAYQQREASGDMLPGTTSYNEFLPRRVGVLPFPNQRLLDDYADGQPVDKAHFEILPDDVEIEPLENHPDRDRWRVQSDEPFTLEILTFDWPGWNAEMDGQPVEITPSDPHGFITIDVPAGDHEVRVFLAPTGVQNIGIIITLVSVVGLGITVFAQQRLVGTRPIVSKLTHTTPHLHLKIGLIVGGILSLLLLLALMREGVAWVKSPPGQALTAQHPTNYHLGDAMQLIGYDLPVIDAQAGGWLELTLYWYADQTPAYNYATFVHITADPNQPPAAQGDKPAPAGRITREWTPDFYVRDEYAIPLPQTLSPGEYQIRVGLWTCDVNPCARLQVSDKQGVALGDSIPLATVTVR
jgi:hypothetical protein